MDISLNHLKHQVNHLGIRSKTVVFVQSKKEGQRFVDKENQKKRSFSVHLRPIPFEKDIYKKEIEYDISQGG